ANGHMEQEIMTIIPSLNMVVAARGDWGTFEPGNADAGMNQNLKLLSESAIGPAPNTIVSSTPVPSDEGFLSGQVILNPDNPRYMVYNRDDDADGQLDPFFWAGPGGPEGFLFRGSINPDGTRTGDQQAIIDAIGSSGANAMYVQMVRSHGGDGESTHNPWQNNDPSQPLNQAVLDQWDGWLAEMDRQGITVLLFFYDDSANPFPTGDAVSTHERSYIEGIVNAFEHHENIIWAIAEEYHEALSDTRTSAIAAEIRAADDHNHLIAVHHATGDNTMNFPDDPNIEIFAHQSDSTDETELHADVMTAFDDAAGRFPVVMSEGLNSHGPALQNGDRAALRRLNWATAMAGASVMVFGTWESSDQFGDGAPTEAMLADWGRQRQFFERTSFHEMVPDNSLKSGDTQHLLANPGEAYIAYASDLSESMGIHEMTAGTYTLTWLDTVSGATVTETQTLDAGSQHFAKPADLGSEVALYIQKNSESPAAVD
ncbi:MAG: hypothetical protein K8L99_30560, partial [Anaerolineae bacterium]|nr:hypothetical protein [Anaerolineae bacterium]